MPATLTTEGKIVNLSVLLGKSPQEDLVLKLFKNDVTPAVGNTAASYTEATFTGYSAKTLLAAGWTLTGSAPIEATFAQQVYTSTADAQNESVYGWYLVKPTGNKVVYAERFTGGPFVVVNEGDQIKCNPKMV